MLKQQQYISIQMRNASELLWNYASELNRKRLIWQGYGTYIWFSIYNILAIEHL